MRLIPLEPTWNRNIVLCLTICFVGCGKIVDRAPSAHAFFTANTVDGRRSFVVMRSPTVVCRSATGVGSPFSAGQELAIAPDTHDQLVDLVDNTELVDRYRVDARTPGSARECIEGTSSCHDPGIDLSSGSLLRLAYALYIPPKVDVAWTEETTEMFDSFSAVVDECLANGTPTNLWEGGGQRDNNDLRPEQLTSQPPPAVT